MKSKKSIEEFVGKFNEINEPYINRNFEENAKEFNSIIFRNFTLNLSGTSFDEEDNPKQRKLKLSDTESLLLSENEKIEIKSEDLMRINLKNTPLRSKLLFNDCDFKILKIDLLTEEVIFENCNIEVLNINNHSYSKIGKTLYINGGIIKELNIANSMITNKFYINKNRYEINSICKIGKLNIEKSVFQENFKLHNCEVKELIIDDTDFEKNADFYKSSFLSKTANCFNAINFKKLALFGETHFEGRLIFKYVTFEGMCHFNSAVLDNGLDLEYTNIKENINFYGINIKDKSNTSQETYRIIKHNFEKLGNKIEANRYHALELTQKRIELKNDKSSDWKERWVFNLHHWSSLHSTNWFRVILWILFVGALTIGFVNIHLIIDLLLNPSLFKIEYISKAWNELCQFIYIGYMEDKLKEHPLTFLFNKISLGYLYYQFLMSVRKDTRK